MIIKEAKINGIKNPVGFQLTNIILSWKVEDSISTHAKYVKIDVSKDKDFFSIIYSKEGEDLSSLGTLLEMNLLPRTIYYYRIIVTGDKGNQGISDTYYFETGKGNEEWEGKWIGPGKDFKYHPIILKSFFCQDKVAKARLYICGLGLYEAYINKKKVGNEYLAPFINDYDSGLQYSTYDVTDLINYDNTISILLGNGWYKGKLGYKGQVEVFGDRFATIAELVIEYRDGTIEKIVTDYQWSYKGSTIECSDIYDGEVINKELWKNRANPLLPVEEVEIKRPLVERYSMPLIVKEEIKVKEVIKTPKGEIVLDMGQNFSGFMEFELDLSAGQTITLEYGEVLQEGNFYRDNYRGAKARFSYTSDGSKERVGSHFSFYGFRYVKISGWIGEINPDNFKGKVLYSDLDQTGFIETSNPKLNQLFLNSLWGQKSNFLDIPTDCPQRDERLAWTGDAQVFAPTACYHMDTRAFFHKFLKDLRFDQLRNNGLIPAYIPSLEDNYGSSVWGDAATFIPYTLYEYYGCKDNLREYYPMMKDWVDSITRRDKERGQEKYLFDFGFHFGDWLAMDGVTERSFKGSTEDAYIASAYYYASSLKVAKAAEILGYSEDAKKYNLLAQNIKNAFIDEYYTRTGRLSIDTQTGYFVALRFKLYLDLDKVLNGLKIRLKKDCYKIKGGFVGATMMCSVLAEYGLDKMAYDFLLNEEFPSWLYQVNLGATTIWERWNSLNPDGSVSDTGMNSFNHYSYGSVMEFLYRYGGGIVPLEPGFKKIRLEPHLTNRLEYLNCTYNSASGKIVSNWRIGIEGELNFHFEIPFGVTALVKLPDSNNEIELQAGAYDFTYRPTKDYLQKFNLSSRLEELAKDQEAIKILEEELPIAAEMISGGDKEDLSLALNELYHMEFLGFVSEDIDAAIKRLLQIKVEFYKKEEE